MYFDYNEPLFDPDFTVSAQLERDRHGRVLRTPQSSYVAEEDLDFTDSDSEAWSPQFPASPSQPITQWTREKYDASPRISQRSYFSFSPFELSPRNSPPITQTTSAQYRSVQPVFTPSTKELKYFEVRGNDTISPASIIDTSLNAVQLGTLPYNRNGRDIFVHSIHFNATIFSTSSVSVTDYLSLSTRNRYRIALILDSSPDVNLSLGEIYANMPGTSGADPDIHSFINLGNTQRFTVIRDIQGYFDATPQAVAWVQDDTGVPLVFQRYSCQSHARDIEFSYTFPEPIKIQFNSNVVSSVDDISTNNILLVGFRKTGDNSRNLQIDYRTRIRFTD